MSFYSKARQCRNWLKKIVFLKEKSGVAVKVPLFTKIKYNWLGFTDLQYVIFDLKHNDHRQYISMRERYRLEYVNGPYASMLGQKLLFERTFREYIHVPPIFCWVKDGRLIDLENSGQEVDICSLLKTEKALIAKPNHSLGGGKGIFKISYEDGKYSVDGETVSEEELPDALRKYENFLFVKVIENHDYAKSIFPGAANTMRVVTVMNRDHSDAEVLFAFHRFGTVRSQPADNMSRGGLFAYIDLDTGTCSKAKQLHSIDQEFSTHPDTGAAIEGLTIPYWNHILESLKKAHRAFPFYEFFAWDVVIGTDGEPYILEINRGSDLSIQTIHPMRNDKLGQYMREHGLLDRR